MIMMMISSSAWGMCHPWGKLNMEDKADKKTSDSDQLNNKDVATEKSKLMGKKSDDENKQGAKKESSNQILPAKDETHVRNM